ncbi:MAG TPA: plasmid pRiA4b ORF-3 family protein [Gemmataceae bacterium]|nr:plasmid pRiA4b ORF-3 family protein [Gemmataceae bacterium]
MSKSKAIYQLKVTLADIKPPIWRRIEVADCSLAKLHDIIQECMGWHGGHLWSFEIGGEDYGADPFGELDMADPKKARLAKFVEAGYAKFNYTYDFGDNWIHHIVVEKVLDADSKVRYPRCVKGARACPPEDCGGPWGYADFLEAINNPGHERHAEMMEWHSQSFDPERFEVGAINRNLVGIR